MGCGWIVGNAYEAGGNEFGRPPPYERGIIPHQSA